MAMVPTLPRGRALTRAVALLAILAAGPAAGGCGGSAEEDPDEPTVLNVTRDFGADRLGSTTEGSVPEGQTVLELLQEDFDVETSDGGGTVQSVGGLAGGRRRGRPVRWFAYVNGVGIPSGAARRAVAAGDRIWFDHHDAGGASRIPAVVGSFPQPFLSGTEGKRLPVRIECAAGTRRECDEVTARLESAGIERTARSTIGQAQENEVLRVLVGPWAKVRLDPVSVRLERGPAVSGVFARFDRPGRRLQLFDARGTVVRTLGPGSGLVAATSLEGGAPVWLVTGTDQVGVAAAAASIREERLRARFAVAVSRGEGLTLPVAQPTR